MSTYVLAKGFGSRSMAAFGFHLFSRVDCDWSGEPDGQNDDDDPQACLRQVIGYLRDDRDPVK